MKNLRFLNDEIANAFESLSEAKAHLLTASSVVTDLVITSGQMQASPPPITYTGSHRIFWMGQNNGRAYTIDTEGHIGIAHFYDKKLRDDVLNLLNDTTGKIAPNAAAAFQDQIDVLAKANEDLAHKLRHQRRETEELQERLRNDTSYEVPQGMVATTLTDDVPYLNKYVFRITHSSGEVTNVVEYGETPFEAEKTILNDHAAIGHRIAEIVCRGWVDA